MFMLLVTWGDAISHAPTSISLLDECNLRYISSIALPLAQFRNACITARASGVTCSQFVKHLLDNQFIRERFQDKTPCMQFDNHRLIGSLESLLCLILIRNNAQ